MRRSRGNGRGRAAFCLVSPFCLVFAATFVAPIGYAIYQSLFTQKRSGLGLEAPRRVFAGVDNYTKALSDGALWSGVGRVLLFGVIQIPIMLSLALLLALLLDTASARFTRFFKLSYFLPYAIPGVIGAIMWAYLYQPDFSPFPGLLGVDLLGSGAVLWSIANVVTWAWTGFNMLIIYTALQTIPRELYEAAELDGASGWKVAWRIKIPLVRPAIMITAIFSIIGTLQLFNEPTVLRGVTANIASDFTPAMLTQSAAFGGNDYNYAAAIAVLLGLAAGAMSFLVFRFGSRAADS